MRPLSLAGLLYLGAALAVFPLARRGGSPELRRQRKHIVRLGAAVFLGGCVAPVLLLLGLAAAPAASVSLWLNLETVATALLAWAFFKEPMTAKTWAAVALVSAAGGLLISPSGFALVPAAGLVALSCACWGLENNLVSVIDGYTPAQITFAKGLVAGVLNLGLGIALEGRPTDARFMLLGIGIGTLGYGVSILLHIAGSHHLGATRAQALFSTAPFVGMLISWTVLREAIEGAQLLAAVVMAAGIALMLTGRHAHEHRHQAMNHTHDHVHDDHHGHAHDEPVAAGARHAHVHDHVTETHAHHHDPDLHHRHDHPH